MIDVDKLVGVKELKVKCIYLVDVKLQKFRVGWLKLSILNCLHRDIFYMAPNICKTKSQIDFSLADLLEGKERIKNQHKKRDETAGLQTRKKTVLMQCYKIIINTEVIPHQTFSVHTGLPVLSVLTHGITIILAPDSPWGLQDEGPTILKRFDYYDWYLVCEVTAIDTESR